jgi:hypothetical protein
VGVNRTGTPFPAGEDTTTGALASKLRGNHPDLPVRSGAWIDPADPTTLDLPTAREGTVVHLRPLRRHERELVARFFGELSAESRRRHGEVTWKTGTSWTSSPTSASGRGRAGSRCTSQACRCAPPAATSTR